MMPNIKYILIAIPAFWLLVTIFVYTFQKTLIFNGRTLPQDHLFKFKLPHEEITLTAKDGTKINAVYIKTNQITEGKKSKGVVLYFHGNSSNLQWYGQYQRFFTSRGYDFFAIDYRGYGKSEGTPSDTNLYSDARMAYDFIKKNYATKDIIIYGKSLGTAIATRLASQVEAKMLLLETPYDQMRNVVASRVIPLWLPFPLKIPLENVLSLPKVEIPVVIFHGTKDEVIAYRLADRLRAKLKPNDTFITIEDAKHRDLEDFPEFQEGLDTFLGK